MHRSLILCFELFCGYLFETFTNMFCRFYYGLLAYFPPRPSPPLAWVMAWVTCDTDNKSLFLAAAIKVRKWIVREEERQGGTHHDMCAEQTGPSPVAESAEKCISCQVWASVASSAKFISCIRGRPYIMSSFQGGMGLVEWSKGGVSINQFWMMKRGGDQKCPKFCWHNLWLPTIMA